MDYNRKVAEIRAREERKKEGESGEKAAFTHLLEK
jgi:hypothetical protein